MITSIQGILTAATPLHATVELNGFGYEVNIPLTTAEKMPQVGSTVRLHTHVIYREDSQTLYGFAATADRDFFRMMIEHVTGVGPKVALSIMSRLSLPMLQSAIRTGDVNTLAKCPGIGKKTAERLVVELRSRLGAADTVGLPAADSAEASTTDTTQRDAVAALVALGYRPADADQAIRRAALSTTGAITTEALIKRVLSQ
jgi:Holliday junction DNA helicase RuvA